MVEFSMAVPLLILLVAGIIDIGSFFYQMELGVDAIRYGTREAARRTVVDGSGQVQCSVIKELADQKATDYFINVLKIPQQQWELSNGGAKICRLRTNQMVYPIAVIKQELTITATAIDTCLFCYLGNFTQIKPVVTHMEMLMRDCCNGMACNVSNLPAC